MSGQPLSVEEVKPKIDEFLRPLLKAARLQVDYEVGGALPDNDFISPDVTVNFRGKDVGVLLAHKAEVLLALEQLTLEALRIPHEDRFRVIFDADDYRLMRIEELRMSAEAAAEKVKRTGKPFHFNPMTSRERRILHLALREDGDVVTVSEGEAAERRTVIYRKGDERAGASS